MKSIYVALLGFAALQSPVFADQALAQKSNCLACHQVANKVVGPSFKDIAKKYAGKDASATLVGKVKGGGSGAWGAIPMPANPQLSDDDAKKLVSWILSMK